MADNIISKQELIDAQKDAKTLEDVINSAADVEIISRLGRKYKSLATITRILNDLQDAINTIIIEDSVPAIIVSDASGDNQQQINLKGAARWYSKTGGFDIGDRVLLDNGNIVKSTSPNNTNNPNESMLGWELSGSGKDSDIQTWSGLTQEQENKAFITTTTVDAIDSLATFVGRKAYVKGLGLYEFNGVKWTKEISLTDQVTPQDFGAIGDGVADDTQAFNDAINSGKAVFVPPSHDYNIAGTLALKSGTFLYSHCPSGASFGGSGYPQTARLIFTGAGASCFVNDNPAVGIYHGGITNLVIQTSTRDWMFDLNGVLGWNFTGLRCENQKVNGGGFRAQAIGSDPSWLNRMFDVEMRVPDASTAYNFDINWTDSDIIGCAFTGGKGAIDRSQGNVKYNACIFDRANMNGGGLTLSADAGGNKSTTLNGCIFDANDGYGLILDARLNTSGYFMPTITGCAFRNFTTGVLYDIYFNNVGNTTKPMMNGGVISGCTFTQTQRTPMNLDEDVWQGIVVAGNSYAGLWQPTNIGSYSGNVVLDYSGLSVPSGGAQIHGSVTVRGKTNVAAVIGQVSGTSGLLLLGSNPVGSAFVGASRDSSGTPFDLSLETDATPRVIIAGNGTAMYPNSDGVVSLGLSNRRMAIIYSSTGTINTSDFNLKEQITDLSEVEREVALSLKPLIKKFKFKDAVQLKGSDARWHVGVIAQEVIAAFELKGLNAFDYGLACYDEWEEKPEILDDEGSVLQEYESAGNRYAIRYDELAMFILSSI